MLQFKNLIEVTEYFSDKQKCMHFLTEIRWNGCITCPHCGKDKIYVLRGATKRFKCAGCRKQFSATKGTIFENSPIPLQKWFVAVYIISSHKKGISSIQLSRDLGVTQKTAWFMAQRIRFALKVKSFTKMDGVVQCDESFFGGKNKNRHADKKIYESQGRSVKDKTPVLGMLQIGGDVHATVVPDTKASTLKPVIYDMVQSGSIVVTDEWLGYNGLSRNFAHVVINHKSGEYVRGAFHTNNIENFWSLLKRGIYGIFHQVSAKHLHRYLDEFAFRYNTRTIADNARFGTSFNNIERRLTYKQLINK